MPVIKHAYARAGLVGNPSDGYFGKTISFVIRQYKATVTLTESDHFEIIPGSGDTARFDTVGEFLRDVKLNGYYGGMRLLKAIVKKVHEYAARQNIALPLDRNFTLQFETDIPRLVGMSGSSAIVCAAMKACLEFYKLDIPMPVRPNVILAAEKEELNITAGLQDRVIQTYEGLTFMDFDKALFQARGYGDYVSLKPPTPPPLYIAFDPDRAEVSDVTHRNLRALFDQGDRQVVEAMTTYRGLTDRARAAIEVGDWKTLHEVTNANFDLRKTIMPIAPENQKMIDVARRTGASAKFAGSGGAICGVFNGEGQFDELAAALKAIGCTTIKPRIFEEK